MTVSIDLTGRRILVVGASSGLGAATARSIVVHGGSVAMLARRKERLDELSAELGERAFGIRADVTDHEALEEAVAEAARALGGLDGIVTVAGRSMVGTIATGTPQRWRELIDLNLVGPLATIRYALPHLATEGRRDVVLVGSTSALSPLPGVAIYGASKSGLKAASATLRHELAPSGISVSLVLPGMFATEGLTMEGIEFDGDVPDHGVPVMVPGAEPADPAVLGDTIAYLLGLPEGVSVQEIIVRPTGQLAP